MANIFKEGFLFLKVLKNNLEDSRFGFVVSKKNSKKAVLRNKIKRKLREAVRIRFDKIKKGVDGVIIVKSVLTKEEPLKAEELIVRLFKKAGILI